MTHCPLQSEMRVDCEYHQSFSCTLEDGHELPNTGCPTISVKSNTPLFLDICWWIRLPFYVLNKQCGGFDFLKKKFKFFILLGSGPGTSSAWFSGSAQFAASSSSCYPPVFNFLDWKPFHMVNLTSKIHIWGQIYHVKWFPGHKIEYLQITWAWNGCKTGWAWKPGWACTWPWHWQNKKIKFFF